MKISKYELNRKLVAYAVSFVSFILPKIKNVNEIILFGSAARGEADKNSDIDLFINIKAQEKKVKNAVEKEINKFYKSKIAETWLLKGIENPLKVKVGDLDKWKLKRSIISDGIVLYGKYKKSPEKLKGFTFFKIEPIKNITKRNLVLRRIFGRKEKNYSTKGMLKKLDGKKLSASSFILPLENSGKIINLLNSEKVDYRFFELWSDQV